MSLIRGGLLVGHLNGSVRKIIFSGSIVLLITILFLFKYMFNIAVSITSILGHNGDFSFLKLGAVIGLSYYTLSAIGYLVDVYWENTPACKNIFDVFLFIFFFPQLISGPITRFGKMNPQFDQVKAFDSVRVINGIRRMAWGYFKKLVVSERFSLIVNVVYTGYSEYGFFQILGASLCYAMQLYTDFSGCMDIVMGAAYMFGIDLPENFNAPFFSETLQEFWQRWHITLGLWFKDYLMYPVQKSSLVQKLGKKSKKAFGKKAGKKIPLYFSMLILWFLLGLWHGGTLQYFIASGVIPFIFLTVSDLCQPAFKAITKALKINPGRVGWKAFRIVRTSLFMCIIWAVICSGEINYFFALAGHSFTHLIGYKSVSDIIAVTGLETMDLFLMAIGTLLVFAADYCTYRGESIFKVMDRQKGTVRVLCVYAEVFIIFVYGMVGQSPFIYFQF